MAFVGGNLLQLNVFIALADGEDEYGRVGERKLFLDFLCVECTDNDAVIAQFYRFQQHALRSDAHIHVQHLAFWNGVADNDEGFGLGAWKRQVQFRQHTAQLDVFQHLFRTSLFRDQLEPQCLLVLR